MRLVERFTLLECAGEADSATGSNVLKYLDGWDCPVGTFVINESEHSPRKSGLGGAGIDGRFVLEHVSHELTDTPYRDVDGRKDAPLERSEDATHPARQPSGKS